ncbi:YchJ family protein [Cryobacterium sp. M91]|uniref:YchJ family protein n=1 Tax=Cryobacterium sp. M91 TaxID=2048294 RepID=UPI000CE39909|nr:YchJ family protein [Cryobacterium sp. M91]
MHEDVRCPCLSGDTYSACCGRFHAGAAVPSTAQWLMRSRYSAFALGHAQYLLDTWHPLTKPSSLELDPSLTWRRLDILRTESGGMLDSDGVVEFTAHYRQDGIPGQQHEVSRFQKVTGRWYYLDGESAG